MEKSNSLALFGFAIFSVTFDAGLILLITRFMDNTQNAENNLYFIALAFLIISLLTFNIALITLPILKKHVNVAVVLGGLIVSGFYLIIQLSMTFLFYSSFSSMIFIAISLILGGLSFASILLIYSISKKASSWGKTNQDRLFHTTSDNVEHINCNYHKNVD